MFTHFVANSEKVANTFLGGPPRLLRYYIGRVIEIYYNTTKGGGVFPIYYNITMRGGGSLGTPNLYYVIYGRPHIVINRKDHPPPPHPVLRNTWTVPYQEMQWVGWSGVGASSLRMRGLHGGRVESCSLRNTNQLLRLLHYVLTFQMNYNL